nr:MAG TPA: hypothetical protein [Caudoviricetes sp.]
MFIFVTSIYLNASIDVVCYNQWCVLLRTLSK